MPMWIQHVVALALVAACGGFTLWQGVKAAAGKRSKLGSCCEKGCGAAQPSKPGAPTQKIHFLPAEMLVRRKK